MRTAKTVPTLQYGTFKMGYEEYVPRIDMQQTADLNKVAAQAAAGGTYFIGDTGGGYGEASTRIEFVAIDLNADGDVTDDDEGFFKVYRSNDEAWVVGAWDNDLRNNTNCGAHYAGNLFVSAADHPYDHDGNPATADKTSSEAVTSGTSRCYLGGDSTITNGFVVNDGIGAWLPYTGTQAPGLVGRPDAGYLFPLARRYNPTFKGVIAVSGKVALSGVVRGKVTLSATDDIIFADDVVYATNAGAGLCQDMLGVFSGNDVIVADNLLNAPQQPWTNQNHRTYDDTSSEFFDGVVLALNIFTVQNYNQGSKNDEPCEAKVWGRGCLYLTGGIIQSTRGAVGTGSGTGYVKRYSYDACASEEPPPYFPDHRPLLEGSVLSGRPGRLLGVRVLRPAYTELSRTSRSFSETAPGGGVTTNGWARPARRSSFRRASRFASATGLALGGRMVEARPGAVTRARPG